MIFETVFFSVCYPRLFPPPPSTHIYIYIYVCVCASPIVCPMALVVNIYIYKVYVNILLNSSARLNGNWHCKRRPLVWNYVLRSFCCDSEGLLSVVEKWNWVLAEVLCRVILALCLRQKKKGYIGAHILQICLDHGICY